MVLSVRLYQRGHYNRKVRSVATDASKDNKSENMNPDATSVHNEKLNNEDVKTDSDAAKPFELHTGDRLEGTPPNRFRQVRGVNPNTGANPGLIQRVADDDVKAALAIALRRMPVGTFQPLNGDLRTVEASAKAAEAFVDAFGVHGLGFVQLSDEQAEQIREDTGLSDIAHPAIDETDDAQDTGRAEDLSTKPNANVHRQTDNVKDAPTAPNPQSPKDANRPDENKGAKAEDTPVRDANHPKPDPKAESGPQDKSGRTNK